MKREIRNLEDLSNFDNGVVGALFENKLREVLTDINERLDIETGRKLSIVLSFKPKVDEGMLCGVFTEVEVETSVPPSRTRTINMGKKGVDTLVWDDLSTDNVHQTTLELEKGGAE